MTRGGGVGDFHRTKGCVFTGGWCDFAHAGCEITGGCDFAGPVKSQKAMTNHTRHV